MKLSELSDKAKYIMTYIVEDFAGEEYINLEDLSEVTCLPVPELTNCIREELFWLNEYTICQAGDRPGIYVKER